MSSSPPISNVFDFLRTLPADVLDSLYDDRQQCDAAHANPTSWVCRAVLQSLPPLPKQMVMRLLCVEEAVPRKVLRSWVHERYETEQEESLSRLMRLRIFVEGGAGDKAAVCLNPPFRKNLLRALVHADVAPWKDNPAHGMKPDKDRPSPQKIEGEMHRRWERVLHLLVGSDPELSGIVEPPPSIVGFVRQAGLMAPVGDGPFMSITNLGFEFMLKDISTQAWMFVLARMQAQSTEQARKELLCFLFMLSACRAGEDYPLVGLTEAQSDLARLFIDLGLLYQRKPSSTRFYTTSVAVNIIFGAPPAGGMPPAAVASGSGLDIIVQTNYQLVAYTTNPLHAAMLSLFAEIRVRLPNVLVGTISRESIMRALLRGIPSRQILDFLEFHAHPTVARRNPVVPENIGDQIILWERERKRVSYTKGILLDLHLASPHIFSQIVAYAKANGGLLWSSPVEEKRLLVIPRHGYKTTVKYADSLLSQ